LYNPLASLHVDLFTETDTRLVQSTRLIMNFLFKFSREYTYRPTEFGFNLRAVARFASLLFYDLVTPDIVTKGCVQRPKLTKCVCLTDFTCVSYYNNGECRLVETIWKRYIYAVAKDIVSTTTLIYQDAYVKSVKHTGLVCFDCWMYPFAIFSPLLAHVVACHVT